MKRYKSFFNFKKKIYESYLKNRSVDKIYNILQSQYDEQEFEDYMNFNLSKDDLISNILYDADFNSGKKLDLVLRSFLSDVPSNLLFSELDHKIIEKYIFIIKKNWNVFFKLINWKQILEEDFIEGYFSNIVDLPLNKLKSKISIFIDNKKIIPNFSDDSINLFIK